MKSCYKEGIITKKIPEEKVVNICRRIDKTNKQIIKAFSYSLSGKYDMSIKIIQNLILKFKDFLIRPIYKTISFRLNKSDTIYFYKGRIVETPYSNFSYKDMHIIPADKRELTSTQRYSIPGVPCLYLSTNSFVLWNELGRPRFENLCVSCFKILNNEMKVIDLSISYNYVYKEIVENYLKYEGIPVEIKTKDGNLVKDIIDIRFSELFENITDDKYVTLASIYPLLAAVSIHCKDKNRTFKSEYVISQLMMHCLGGCKGVLYRSSAMDGKYGLPSINLAIPNLRFNKENINNLFGVIGNIVEVTDSFNLQYYIDNCSNKYYRYKRQDHNDFEIYNLPCKSTFNKMLVKLAGSNTYDLNFIYKGSIYYFFDEFLINRPFNKI